MYEMDLKYLTKKSGNNVNQMATNAEFQGNKKEQVIGIENFFQVVELKFAVQLKTSTCCGRFSVLQNVFHTASYSETGRHAIDLNDAVLRKAYQSFTITAWSVALKILDFTAIRAFHSELF